MELMEAHLINALAPAVSFVVDKVTTTYGANIASKVAKKQRMKLRDIL